MLKIGCCIVLLISILLFGNGCQTGLYGGWDWSIFYPDNDAITGNAVGDPYKSRGSGMSRSTSTAPMGFQSFSPKNGD